MRGKLIVFEGGEGSGKTTQIKRLHDWLGQHTRTQALLSEQKVTGIKLTREPGGTALGAQIRALLLTGRPQGEAPIASKTELLLYAADRAQHVEETIRPWLEAGCWVLCDRYTDSTVAYQGYGRQLDLSLIHQLNEIATGGLKSDLTLWLNVSADVGLARMRQRAEADRIEQQGQPFHQRVYEGFAELAKPQQGHLVNAYSSGPVAEIDAHFSEATVAAQVQQVFQKRVNQWYPPSL